MVRDTILIIDSGDIRTDNSANLLPLESILNDNDSENGMNRQGLQYEKIHISKLVETLQQADRNKYAGIILSGRGREDKSIFEEKEHYEVAYNILLEQEIPVLAICGGHQRLAFHDAKRKNQRLRPEKFLESMGDDYTPGFYQINIVNTAKELPVFRGFDDALYDTKSRGLTTIFAFGHPNYCHHRFAIKENRLSRDKEDNAKLIAGGRNSHGDQFIYRERHNENLGPIYSFQFHPEHPFSDEFDPISNEYAYEDCLRTLVDQNFDHFLEKHADAKPPVSTIRSDEAITSLIRLEAELHSRQIFKNFLDEAAEYKKGLDALIVPSGSMYKNGILPESTKKRVEKAVDLYYDELDENTKIIMSTKWSFLIDGKKNRPPHTEAYAMKEYALEYAESISKSSKELEPNILLEEESKETIGNAVYTKCIYLEPNDWKRVGVVTSEFHMPRVKQIFNRILGDEYTIRYFETENMLDGPELWQRNQLEKFLLNIFENDENLTSDHLQGKAYLETKHFAYSPDGNHKVLRTMMSWIKGLGYSNGKV
ncbi:MAG: YdcF family protein [Nanoarchaeota archaeon]|nr:YdcF family protein [Nanoarchaeota archaeon]